MSLLRFRGLAIKFITPLLQHSIKFNLEHKGQQYFGKSENLRVYFAKAGNLRVAK